MADSLGRAVREAVEVPVAAEKVLEYIQELCTHSKPLNFVELKYELNEVIWWGAEPGSPEAEDQMRQRLRIQGWALQELENIMPEPNHGLCRLQIVLTALLIASPSDKAAMDVVPQEMAHPPLLDGLEMLLRYTATGVQCHRYHAGDRLWSERVQAASRREDYRELGSLIRHLEMELSPDFSLAVMLLAKFSPDRLARHIEERQDVFFSVAVRGALAEDSLKFALSVNDITFKFVCASPLADAQIANAPEGSVDAICELLLQVAKTEFWYAWLLDFARYPKAESVAERAISEALTQLTAAHWAVFVSAVELWAYTWTAEPIANILVPFFHNLGGEKSVEMWRLAFERWNKWDYGCDEKDNHLSAPSACSFDFPVAMYYALLPLEEAQAEECRLLEEIATVEQKWFADFSALVTYRNRLSSRLRLVRHGFTIRNFLPGVANPLPPRIEAESEFAEIRYQFFDVSTPRRSRG